MSWAEVKKINGDMTIPINHWLWANDYKTYGEQSYAYRNKTIFAEFLQSTLAINDEMLAGQSFEQYNAMGQVHVYFDRCIGFDATKTAGLKNATEIAANATALDAVLDNVYTFNNVLLKSQVLKDAIINNIQALVTTNNNVSYKSYIAAKDAEPSTETLLGKVYLISIVNATCNSRTSVKVGAISGGQSGIQYTKLDGQVVTACEAVSNADELFRASITEHAVNSIILSTQQLYGEYTYYSPDGSGNSKTTLASTFAYKTIF